MRVIIRRMEERECNDDDEYGWWWWWWWRTRRTMRRYKPPPPSHTHTEPRRRQWRITYYRQRPGQEVKSVSVTSPNSFTDRLNEPFFDNDLSWPGTPPPYPSAIRQQQESQYKRPSITNPVQKDQPHNKPSTTDHSQQTQCKDQSGQ